MPAGAPPENQTAFRELELLKLQRAKLSRYLRPKHPKIVKLDADIERAEKLIDIFQRQSRAQLVASRSTIQMKIDNVLDTIKEWESKVFSSRDRLAEGERLKLNVSRAQNVYERLFKIFEDFSINQKIDQETLAILDPPSPAQRSYLEEISLLGVASAGGLGLGLAIILLLVRARSLYFVWRNQ